MNQITIGTQKKKLLIIHGWMESGALYYQLAHDLKEAYTVTLIDLPGFGESPPVKAKNIVKLYTKKLINLMNNEQFDVVIGHSTGGTVLIRALNQDALNFNGHVVLANPEYLGIPHLKPVAWAWPINQLLFSFQKALPFAVAKPILTLFGRMSMKNIRCFSEQLAVDCHRSDPYTSAKLGQELAFDRFVWTTHRELKSVRIFMSEYDHVVSNKHIEMLIEAIPSSKKVFFEGIGHMVILEAYDDFLAEIQKIIP